MKNSELLQNQLYQLYMNWSRATIVGDPPKHRRSPNQLYITDMAKAQELFDKAFFEGRAPRSDEYRKGVMDALRFRFDGAKIACPWPQGTAQADAYYAGVNEGHGIWRNYEMETAAGREG